MSSYSRQHRSSWHVGYSPSVDVNSNTTSSYGRYGSSDYAAEFSGGGYRRHSATTSDHNRYGGSGGTGADSRIGGASTSDYRRYSSSTEYSKRYSTGTALDKYGSSGSSDCRKKSWDFSTNIRRGSTTEGDRSVVDIQEPGRRRNSTRDKDGADKPESVRMRRSKYDRTDAEINDSARTVSLESNDTSESSAAFRRKCSIDSRRTHLGLDYNKVVGEDDGKCWQKSFGSSE